VTLLEATMDQVPGKPKRLVADRGYDSDPLRERMSQRGTELICPYRRNNRRRRHHDGRKLRRYKHRWIVERTISWLGNYRRVLIRWERNVQHYLAFVHVACLMIALRQL
jgi:transposase